MGREVRKVAEGWEHPKDNCGEYIPLYEGPFSKYLAQWVEEQHHWDAGEVLDYSKWPKERVFKLKDLIHHGYSYEEYAGKCPCKDEYMPEWSADEASMLMMYETCTEGTPISPAFKTPEELALWLVDNNASAFGDLTASYDQWLRVCQGGVAPSAVIVNGVLTSGVAGIRE